MEKELLEALIDEGFSQREIAERTGFRQTNIRYWLRKYDLETKTARYPKSNERFILRECKHHGETEFIREVRPGTYRYRCKKCRIDAVRRQRRSLKEQVVLEAGGECIRCGYDRNLRALSFHHRDSTEKEFEIGRLLSERKRSLLREEIKKCDLLCLNCHAEIEDEIIDEWRNGSASA